MREAAHHCVRKSPFLVQRCVVYWLPDSHMLRELPQLSEMRESASSDQEETEPPRSRVNCLRLKVTKARREARTQKSPNLLFYPKMVLTPDFPHSDPF